MVISLGVPQNRNEDSQRAGYQAQRQQPHVRARRDHVQPERDRDGQDQGHCESGPGQPEGRPAEPLRPHILPGQEEQESQAQQVQHLGRALGPDQAQDLRADHDSRQHFEHYRRDQPPRYLARR